MPDVDIGAFAQILNQLVPEGEIVLVDIHGTSHAIPPRVSAKRQVQALRAIRQLIATSAEAAAAVRGAATNAGTDAAQLAVLIDVLGDSPEIMQGVDDAFRAAYPEVAAELGADPSDAFELQDIASALLPFFGRLVGGAARMMAPLDRVTAGN